MNWQERAEKAEAELARMAQQEPVAWMRPDDEGYDSHFRDHSTVVSCPTNPWTGYIPLYAGPVPAVAAPAVPEEWCEVMTELADDLAIEIDQSYPPERRAYPSEQRRYEREMEIVNRARAMLQSSQAAPAVPANLVDTLAGIALKCTDCYTTDAIDALLQSEGCSSQTQNDVRHD